MRAPTTTTSKIKVTSITIDFRQPSFLLPSFVLLPLLLILSLLLQTPHAHALIREVSFVQQSPCGAMILAPEHRFQTQTVRSLVQCTSVCHVTEGCVSVVYGKSSGSCHLGDLIAARSCSNMVVASSSPVVDGGGGVLRYYEEKKTCENGGTVEQNRCICTEPYHGHRCEKVFRDCTDASPHYNDTQNHVLLIKPTSSPAPLPVTCNTKLKRTFIFNHWKKDDIFNRTWQEYVNGFGDLEKNHWLGLEHVRHITQNDRNYSLRFEMELADSSTAFLRYDGFRVNGPLDGYSFSMSAFENQDRHLDDCLSPLLGMPFSTYDNDVDGSNDVNCALRHGFGWWFKGEQCSSICLPLGMRNEDSYLWSGNEFEAFWSMETVNVSVIKLRAYLKDI